jgi:predicted nucleotidyltransferase
MTTVAFDPLRILETLDRHGVKFVIIGGIAGRLWGSTTVTNDLDICYARDPANLAALAAALIELEVQLRGATRDLPFRVDARTLKNGDTFTFTTNAGNFDLLGTPAGSQGYASLAHTATAMDVGDVTVLVTDLEDLIAMKRAAGRPKDLIEIEVLSAVREERDRG